MKQIQLSPYLQNITDKLILLRDRISEKGIPIKHRSEMKRMARDEITSKQTEADKDFNTVIDWVNKILFNERSEYEVVWKEILIEANKLWKKYK